MTGLELYSPWRIELFEVLVAVAALIGCGLVYLQAKRTGLDTRIILKGLFWTLVTGLIAAHLVEEIFYHPRESFENPLLLLKVWGRFSSVGGFLGGALGAIIYFQKKEVQLLPYIEAILFGLIPAWIIGRLGCTIAFDHPGEPTDFFLGMADGDGVVRHNLGYYEMLLAMVLAVALHGLKNFRPFEGFHTAFIILLYAPARFFLDSLRVDDRTYWGLTPGQYFSMALFCLGIFLTIRGLKKRPPLLPPDPAQVR